MPKNGSKTLGAENGNANIQPSKKVKKKVVKKKKVKKKEVNRLNQCVHWRFNYHKYTEEDVVLLEEWLQVHGRFYVFQKETCPKTKGKHLEGYVELKKKDRLNENKTVPIKFSDIQPAKYWKNCITYASRPDKRDRYTKPYTNIKKVKKQVIPTYWDELMPKQQKLIEPIIHSQPDDRSVFWFWEKNGGWGKSYLCRYLIDHYDTLAVSGKATNVFCGFAAYVNKHEYAPDYLIINLVRKEGGELDATIIEKIKDGFLFSEKYESGMIRYNPPHIMVFANAPPMDTDDLTEDKWIIRELENDVEVIDEEYMENVIYEFINSSDDELNISFD